MQDFITSFSAFSDQEKLVKEYQKGRLVDDRLKNEDYVVAVLKGKVSVYNENGVLLTVLKKGECYGVSNLLVGSSLSTKLAVIEDSSLMFIKKDTFRAKLKTDLALSNAYNLYLSQKVDFLLKRISLLTLQSSHDRVKAFLEMEDVQFNTKEEIASYLGISRSQYFKAISALKTEEE